MRLARILKAIRRLLRPKSRRQAAAALLARSRAHERHALEKRARPNMDCPTFYAHTAWRHSGAPSSWGFVAVRPVQMNQEREHEKRLAAENGLSGLAAASPFCACRRVALSRLPKGIVRKAAWLPAHKRSHRAAERKSKKKFQQEGSSGRCRQSKRNVRGPKGPKGSKILTKRAVMG